MSLAFSKEIKENWKLIVVDDADLKGEIRSSEEFQQYAGPVLDAQVPGDWIRDYVRAGLLEEPFFGSNYIGLRDYENSHVFYAVKFDWDREPDGRTFLRFEGIDTVADVWLNGRMIGHAENMLIPHEFAAEGLAKGENELLVLHVSCPGWFNTSYMKVYDQIRDTLAQQNLLFRWGVIFFMVFFILIFGVYGIGYDARSFIYGAF